MHFILKISNKVVLRDQNICFCSYIFVFWFLLFLVLGVLLLSLLLFWDRVLCTTTTTQPQHSLLRLKIIRAMNINDIFSMLMGVTPGPRPGFYSQPCRPLLTPGSHALHSQRLLSVGDNCCSWSFFLVVSRSDAHFCSKVYFPGNILNLWNLSQ